MPRTRLSVSPKLGPVSANPLEAVAPNAQAPVLGRQTIVNAFWSGNKVVIVERHDGVVTRRTVDAEYVCYVKAAELSVDAERKLRDYRHVVSMRREGKWWRIRWDNQLVLKSITGKDGSFAREGIVAYEADVSPVRRWMTDNDVVIQRPKRCYVDLEVDSRLPIIRQKEGHARVLTWALTDDDGRKVYGLLQADTDEEESLLLADLWDELLEYDQVCAWGGDDYDFEVMKNRSERLGIQIEPRRWLWLDHLEVYRRFNMAASESGDEKESMALGRIAQAVLGTGKMDFDSSRTFEAWKSNPMQLVDYNITDACLMRDIEAKTGYLELHFTVCETCVTLPDSRGTNPTNFVEGYMLKLGREFDEHFATHWDPIWGDKYEGAYVMEPTKKGVLKGVHVCDFASLYPSIIMSFNLSPETLTDIVLEDSAVNRPSYLAHMPPTVKPIPSNHCYTPYTKRVFRTDVKGVLPRAIENVVKLRKVWKDKKNLLPPGTPEWKEADRRSSGYKIINNSFYGVAGSMFSRFFNRAVAESTSLGGKWLLEETMKAAQSPVWNIECIYGDTDSLFCMGVSDERFTEFVAWCNKELYPRLLKERGCVMNAVKLSYEKKFRRLVILKKKRYAATYEHMEGQAASADSKPEIKGLEFKRGDSLKMARDMQYELVQMLLFQEIESVDVYREWLGKWRDRILKEELRLEDVRMSNSLGKELNGYVRKQKKSGDDGALPVHVEVAHELRRRGRDVGEGVRIEYIVVDGQTPIKAIPVEDWAGEVDRFYLWEAQMYPASQRVLEAALPMHKWKNYLRVRPSKGRTRLDELGQGLLFRG